MEKKCPCYVEGKNTEKRMDMSKALFITGTGTDIGKTYVTGLEVIMWDERLTTVEADRTLIEAGVRRENRKQYLDGIAAVFILQGYLDSLSV